jgi:hypothetical protein
MNEPDWNDPNVQAVAMLSDCMLTAIMMEFRSYDLLAMDFDKGCEALKAIEEEKKNIRETFKLLVDNGGVR